MKILYYSPHPDLNLEDNAGYAVHMRETIQSMRNLGHQVEVFIAGGGRKDPVPLNPAQKSNNFKSTLKSLLPKILWQTLRDFRLLRLDNKVAKALEKAVKDSSPDLIYERGYYLMQSGTRVAKTHGIKHVLELNAPYPEERITMGGRSFLINKSKTLLAKCLQDTDGLVVVSSSLASFYSDKCNIDINKIFVSPNGCRLESFNFDITSARTEYRKKLGLKESTVLFGFVGSVFPYHGVDRFLSAFIKLEEIDLVAKKWNAKIVIVGGGMIQEYARKYSNHASIVFTGEVDRNAAYHYLAAMDVAVMPDSNWYGSPIKIFEYGALNKPIIAPRRKPLEDVMIDGKDGLLVEGVEEITQAMITMLNYPEQRIQMGNSFATKVKECYQWDTLVKKMLDHFTITFTYQYNESEN